MAYEDLGDVHVPTVGGTAIAGWGTTIRENFEHFEDPPFCHARETGTVNIGSGATDVLTLTSSDMADTDNMHNPGGANTERVEINTDGIYHVTGYVEWSAAAGGQRQIRLYEKPTTTIHAYDFEANPSASRPTRQFVSAYIPLTSSDYVYMTGQQTSGGSLTVDTAWLTVRWVARND